MPGTTTSRRPASRDRTIALSAPGTLANSLSKTEYWAAFNPAGDGGVVVLNAPAREVLRCFDHPATQAQAQAAAPGSPDDVDAVVSRLLPRGIIHPVGQPARPAFGESATLTAWLHVSNACNLRCPYCYVHKSAAGMDSRVGRASVDALLGSAHAHGFSTVKLKYAGGEASLNKKLVLELDAYARERAAARGLELQAVLLSNGVALRPAFVEAL